MTRDRLKKDIEGTRRIKNYRPIKKGNQEAMDTKEEKYAKQRKRNACKGISINREVSRSYQDNLDGSRRFTGSIEQTEYFSIDPPIY